MDIEKKLKKNFIISFIFNNNNNKVKSGLFPYSIFLFTIWVINLILRNKNCDVSYII